MSERRHIRSHDAWARMRFAVIGPLLASPPAKGELCTAIEKLAGQTWEHPLTGEQTSFGFSTIESWYYKARNELRDPVGKLRRSRRSDAGKHRRMSDDVRAALRAQYEQHKHWSYQLHRDNLEALAKEQAQLRPLPSYSTMRRWMQSQGLLRQRRRKGRRRATELAAQARHEQREIRSYEAEYVNGLWHLDFHEGSRHVLMRDGTWKKPQLIAVIDDRSRLCCHGQWYLDEDVESLVHGFSQACQKRGLPAELMTDNGGAMKTGEFREGLARLSIRYSPTLDYSPHQNAKIEIFWGSVEGRLLAMLDHHPELTLAVLNEATLAWIEYDYNRKQHSELGMTPVARWLNDKRVGRESPSSEALRKAFRTEERRTQRRSDGTIALNGQRYEIPARYRALSRVCVRYARWDRGFVHMVDAGTGDELCQIYPLDKGRNADGIRRVREPIGDAAVAPSAPAPATAPLLRQMIADYAATGLPPAYLPKDDVEREVNGREHRNERRDERRSGEPSKEMEP